jgi:hypothetical protein
VKGMAKSTFAFLPSLLASVAAYGQSRLDRRAVTVPVEIDNIPATFLVDTGAERTIVDSAFARQLGLKLSEAVLLQGDYSTNEGNAVTAKEVRIGRKLWSDVPLVTQDLSALSRMLAAPRYNAALALTDYGRSTGPAYCFPEPRGNSRELCRRHDARRLPCLL